MNKKIIQLLFLLGIIFFSSCTDLNLNPLSQGSSENWYSNESEITMALNDLYRIDFWPEDRNAPGDEHDFWSDDEFHRDITSPFVNGTLNGQDATVVLWWQNSYKCIGRANAVIASLDRANSVLPQAKIDQYAGDARFVRASQYAKLITYWGDVVYSTSILSLEESFGMTRTDKKTILKGIYDDYDFAASKLPASYGSTTNMHATKGAALAMKARIALFFGDWAIARDAAKACMDLNVYQLYPDYSELFLSKTKNPAEIIFGFPRSTALGVYLRDVRSYLPRLAGGYATWGPSWELFCSYLCTDGLPIDESPLFDPHQPFKNRDPRCSATIVEFQTPWLGFMYQPHPDSLKVMNYKTGLKVTNNDTRANANYASFNGLVWKKWIDGDWTDDYNAEIENILMRYADVLLMYAEAATELGEIDQTMLDASINKVRARAYKVAVTDKTKYPAVTSTNQSIVRKAVRIERRMELAFENRRYEDLIRWKLAEKVLNRNIYGMLDVADLRSKVISKDLWFFPQTPEIDDDGTAILEPLYNAGLIKRLAIRNFPSYRYLWPIPTKDIQVNPNLTQNVGY